MTRGPRPYRRRALVDLVQAAYATAGSDAAWLERVHEQANALLDAGMGSIAYMVDAPNQRIEGIVGDPHLAASVIPMHEEHGAACFDVYFLPRATSLRTFYGDDRADDASRFIGPRAGDIWGATCVDARGRGVVFTAPQGARRGLPLGVRAWTMTAVHLATAWRLHRRRATTEAVLRRDGKLLHREPSAAGDEKVLSAAVVRRAQALRAASAEGSAAALTAWSALASGRWSIVEDVDSDGKRYLVARRNELPTDELPALTSLERQVCAMAAAAHPQKLIAYELGIHPSSVTRHLASAMTKLKVSSVAALARKLSWLPARR